MREAIAVIGVPYAAACVWFAVRIINRREQWAIRALIAMLAFPLMVLAFGHLAAAIARFLRGQ